MVAQLTQAIPGPDHPLVDRYLKPSGLWYPWFVKIVDFIKGLSTGELIVDGAIVSRMIRTGAVLADAIAANAITADKMSVNNIDVLNGTFGDLRTNTGTTRIQITDVDNELRCYISGTLVASIGANVISNGAFLACTSPSSAWYPAQFSNTSTTGGDLSTGGGALICASVGGYAAQFTTSTTSSAAAINAANTGTSGGRGQIGRSSALGSWAFYSLSGGYGPFTGGHDGLLLKSAAPEPGDIMIDGEVIGRQLSDVMTEVHRSSAPNQPALGVYTRRYPIGDQLPPSMDGVDAANWDALKGTHDLVAINALGEGCVNVCNEGGDINVGDLIVTSSRPGKGMRQADDIVRGYTVAKSRERVTFSGPGDVRLCACIYLSG